MPVVGLSLRRRHLRGWEPEVRFFLVLVGLTDCVAEINLSGILTENDITVRCGEGRLFTRWPPFVHIFYGFVHILCGHHICAVLYDLWPVLQAVFGLDERPPIEPAGPRERSVLDTCVAMDVRV